MIEKIKKLVSEHPDFRNSDLKTATYLMHTGSSIKNPGHSRVILMLFRKGEKEPFVVCKLSKSDEYNATLENEYRYMEKMSQESRICPRPILMTRIDGLVCTMEEYIPGKTVQNEIREFFNVNTPDHNEYADLVRRHFAISNDLIRAFDNLTGKGKASDPLQELESVFDFCEASFEFSGEKEKRFLREAKERIGTNLASLFSNSRDVNFDFIPANIKVSGRSFDLEFVRNSSFGFLEFLRFFYYYYFEIHRTGNLVYSPIYLHSMYLMLLLDDGPLAREFKNYFKDVPMTSENIQGLLLVFALHEARIQSEVIQYKRKDFKAYWRSNINFLTGYYLSDEISDLSSSQVDSLNHSIAILHETLKNERNHHQKTVTQVQGDHAEAVRQLKEAVSEIHRLDGENQRLARSDAELHAIKNSAGFRILEKMKKFKFISAPVLILVKMARVFRGK